MATAGNDDDEVEGDEEDEEAEEGGDLDTSLKLFMKKANGQKKLKPELLLEVNTSISL